MKTTLKDLSVVGDPRLDRIFLFDDRSLSFRAVASIPEVPVSRMWKCSTVLDQGREGACVGFGLAHNLLCLPDSAHRTVVTKKYAREVIYWGAQKIDTRPGGSYPGGVPTYEGTAVLAGIKVLLKLGWITSYEWAFGLQDLVLCIGHKGPAILGIDWYDSMYIPNERGFITPRTGKKVGGHCILCRGVDITNGFFILRNSWGSMWGIGGDCYVSFADMDRLLKARGEAAFLIGRKSKI